METGIPVITVTDELIEIKKIPGVDINAEDLNRTLLTLPAKTYLDLFREMYKKVYGYPAYVGNCCCTGTDSEQEEKTE